MSNSKVSLTPSKVMTNKTKKTTSDNEQRNQCVKILTKTSIEDIQIWLKQNKITSYSLRNQKTIYTINLSNNIISKILVNSDSIDDYPFLQYLFENLKSTIKRIEFCKVLKYLSKRDYEFQYLASLANKSYIRKQDNIGLYLKVRNQVINGFLNKGKKQLLGTISAEIQQWFKVAQRIFKHEPQEKLLFIFSEKVKEHYQQFKKDQNSNISGSDFLKICQLIEGQRIEERDYINIDRSTENLSQNEKPQKMSAIVYQATLNGLQQDDKQLIRALSYKDNNIARILQQKHNKVLKLIEQMLRLIAEDVEQLRKNIKEEKKKHLDMVEEKQSIVRKIETIKNYVVDYIETQHSEKSQQKLLNLLQIIGKQYSINTEDVQQIGRKAKNRRLIEIIEAQQRL